VSGLQLSSTTYASGNGAAAGDESSVVVEEDPVGGAGTVAGDGSSEWTCSAGGNAGSVLHRRSEGRGRHWRTSPSSPCLAGPLNTTQHTHIPMSCWTPPRTYRQPSIKAKREGRRKREREQREDRDAKESWILTDGCTRLVQLS